MYSKAKLFGDEDSVRKILAETKPKAIKQLGRKVSPYSDEEWVKQREQLTFTGLFEKYSQNTELKRQLLETGTREIVEASPFDKVWGVGLAENNPLVTDRKNWKGQNILGKILMRVREELLRQ